MTTAEAVERSRGLLPGDGLQTCPRIEQAPCRPSALNTACGVAVALAPLSKRAFAACRLTLRAL